MAELIDFSPEKVYAAIVKIIERRENVKITYTLERKEEAPASDKGARR